MEIADFETYVFRDTGKLWDSLPEYRLDNIYEGYREYLRSIIKDAESKMSNAYFMVQDVKNGERGPITKEDRERYNRRMFGV